MIINNTPQPVFSNGMEKAHSHSSNKSFLESVNDSHKKHELSTNEDSSKINNTTSSSIIPKDENELSVFEQIQKQVIQSILSYFSGDKDSKELFPPKNMQDIKMDQIEKNPYSQSLEKFANGGLVYESTQEYYSKTTLDFTTQATIKTPNGEYNIELNVSFTQEFYAKRTTQFAFDKPVELELDKDDDNLKNLKRIDLVFGLNDDNQDKNKDMFDYLKELLKTQKLLMLRQLDQSEKNDLNPIKNDLFDSFKVWEKNESSEFSLIAASQDGVGVFLSNTQSSSSYMQASSNENGYSYEAGYSSQRVSTMGLVMDIKA